MGTGTIPQWADLVIRAADCGTAAQSFRIQGVRIVFLSSDCYDLILFCTNWECFMCFMCVLHEDCIFIGGGAWS